MIVIIDGDLFESNCEYICHQVNCQGKMGSGVALQVRQKYPVVYEEYSKLCSSLNPFDLLGHIQIIKVEENRNIVNLFSQFGYGYDGKMYTSLDAFKGCLELLKLHLENLGVTSLALPYKIGCCRGGANWNDVYNIIKETFEDFVVELWRFDKG